MKRCLFLLSAALTGLATGIALAHAAATTPSTAPSTAPAVTLTGGHETEGRDRGRPDILVAAGLGVPTDAFREAFSHVRPGPAGTEPDPQQVQANKKALMDALGKYGVTNDRLDEVSNYYRYPPGDKNLWKHTDAVIKAKITNGKVTGSDIEKPGAGYTTPPTISVAGFPNLKTKVTLSFSKDLPKNGSIESITIGEDPK